MADRDSAAVDETESATTLRLAVEAASMGFWHWDAQTNLVVWDDATCRIFGVEPGKGPTNYEDYMKLIHPEDRETLQQSIAESMKTGVYRDVEHRVIWPDKSVHWLFAKGALLRAPDGTTLKIIGGIIDITERKHLEEQLRQSQKMEAVGQLAAGIAHNFNNLLMVILPNVELAKKHATPEVAASLDAIDTASTRAADLVRQLMLFTRADAAAAPHRQPLLPIVQHCLQMCRSFFDRSIKIEFGKPVAAHVIGDSTLLEQCLLNILLNARDALADCPERRVWIDMDVVDSDDPEGAGPQNVPGDRRRLARIAISNSGKGIDPATRQRVFEPFFTTKPVGQGTGLGLATTFAIVKEHDGYIECHDRPGGGVTFVLWLPLADSESTKESSAPPTPREVAGVEHVLVVDDEPLVRTVLERVLTSAGYRVTTADSGCAALASYDRRGAFDLTLLDMSMPGMNGRDVRAQILERDPGAKVIYITGNAAMLASAGAPAPLLEKPVTSPVLLAAVRRALGQDTQSD